MRKNVPRVTARRSKDDEITGCIYEPVRIQSVAAGKCSPVKRGLKKGKLDVLAHKRKFQDQFTSMSRFAVHADHAIHTFHQGPGNRQSEPKAWKRG